MTFLGVEDVDLMSDVSAALWIEGSLWPWCSHGGEGVRVGSVVPSVFEAYLRVFHPARRRSDGGTEPVRWSTVAEWAGRVAHPDMQFERITVPAVGFGRGPVPWDDAEPLDGSLTAEDSAVLARLLAGSTSTPDTCWFAIWDGYGFLHPGGWSLYALPPGLRGRWVRWRLRRRARRVARQRSPIGKVPRFHTEGRDYILLKGPLHAVSSLRFGIFGGFQSPSFWWPDDRAWCVASEIDLKSTYIGGSDSCLDWVLSSPDLETLPTTPDARVDSAGDALNPAPPEPRL